MYFDTVKAKIANPKWTTQNEKDFINRLGQHSLHSITFNTLVHRYLGTAMRRDDWGDVDPVKVVGYVCGLLSMSTAERFAVCAQVKGVVVTNDELLWPKNSKTRRF